MRNIQLISSFIYYTIVDKYKSIEKTNLKAKQRNNLLNISIKPLAISSDETKNNLSNDVYSLQANFLKTVSTNNIMNTKKEAGWRTAYERLLKIRKEENNEKLVLQKELRNNLRNKIKSYVPDREPDSVEFIEKFLIPRKEFESLYLESIKNADIQRMLIEWNDKLISLIDNYQGEQMSD